MSDLQQMAPEEPFVPGHKDQALRLFTFASELTLHALDAVEQGLAELPPGWPVPGEQVDEGSDPAGHTQAIAQILARVPRDWAPSIVVVINDIGREMLDKALFPQGPAKPISHEEQARLIPDKADQIPGEHQVIATLCPPSCWEDALFALAKRHEPGELTVQGVKESAARMESVALARPAGAIYASLAQIAWMSLQPLVADRTGLRAGVQRKLEQASGALGLDAQPLADDVDRAAGELLLTLFDGADFVQVPDDRAARLPEHARMLEVAAKHLRAHGDAAPTAEQADQLRRECMIALGMPVHQDVLDTIPKDALNLDNADVAALEAFALRLLHGMLTRTAAAVSDSFAAINQYGPRGLRIARGHMEALAQLWCARIERTVTIRTGTLIPGMQSLVDMVVPSEYRTRALTAYMPTLMSMQDSSKLVDPHPDATSDLEGDLFLMAVYSGWMGMHVAAGPKQIREQLAQAITYLARPDRTVSALDLSPEQFTLARGQVGELIGKQTQIIGEPGRAWDEADRLLAAAYDSLTDPDAVAQVHLLAECLQQRLDAEAGYQAQAPKPVDPVQQAARRAAERRLRDKRKKKGKR
ncbi:hypothetical protein D5S17_23270 [Pseudonocardiaceae bacterium YIM PH 21723]|nr:hypothetical protein D5S17_23270 [Pseudonocardiaceae bacterium YIM PH 21723]